LDDGDQADACVKAGRKYGIRIHAWKVCWNLAGAPADFLLSLKTAGRLQVTKTGETIPWLCPSHADNIEYEVGAIRELARTPNYELDFGNIVNSPFTLASRLRQRLR